MPKFAIAMSSYAFALIAIGWLTYSMAPTGSGVSSLTAILVPAIGASLVFAAVIFALRIEKDRRMGMIGIHVGLVLPLIMAIGSFWRLPGAIQKNRDYYAASTVAVGGDSTVTVESAKRHPTGYQAVGIGSIGTLSLFAFVTVLLLRPKPTDRAPTAPSTLTPPPSAPTAE